MTLYPESIYHIYNRGNNKQKIFFDRKNYLFFIKKMREYLLPCVDIFCYCLMPNHFHFMVYTPPGFDSTKFGNGLKVLLGSYSRAINIQEQRAGSLFQQNTKAKCLTGNSKLSLSYTRICFNYIHMNPVTSNIVKRMEDWEFSSFKDYIGRRKGTLCNQILCRELLELPTDTKEFCDFSYSVHDSDGIENIF